MLRDLAAGLARTAAATIAQEYPNDLWHLLTGPDDRPEPHEIHPAFYGSFDWHSAVEMHLALVRLLRLTPEAVPASAVEVLDRHLTPDALAAEAQYLAAHPGFSRPFGQGWTLALAHELDLLAGSRADAARWAQAAAPLASTVTANLMRWLPKLTYPVRYGVHPNTAFGLARALPYARAHPESGLADAIVAAAHRFFGADADYPAGWEPSGADFLSPALTEADLMASVLPVEEFAAWFGRFLPALPAGLTEPAIVSDTRDGQLAHLPGLNLSRAWLARRVAAALPADPARRDALLALAERHEAAGLPYVSGGDYMTEHWLACYAVLALSATA